MIKRQIIWGIWLFCWFVTGMQAQQTPFYLSINRSSGLPNNAIYNIFQDSRGFMWFATNEGLFKYDGTRFFEYTSPAQNSKSGTNIKEDKLGRIWYSTFDGFLYYVENDTLKSMKQNPPVGYSPWTISNDKLMVVQKQGLDIFEIESLKLIKTVPLVDIPSFIGGPFDNGFFLLFDINKNLCRIDSDGNRINTPLSKLNELYQKGSNYPSHSSWFKGELYLAEKYNKFSALFKVEMGIDSLSLVPFDKSHFIQNLATTNDYIWICTSDGTFAYDGDDANIRQFFPGKNISCVYKDREGNYWFGTTNEGLLLVPDLKTQTVFFPNIKIDKTLLYKDTLLVGHSQNEILVLPLKDILTAPPKPSPIFKGNVPHEIYQIIPKDIDKKQFFILSDVFYQVQDFNKSRVLSAGAVKDAVPIDDKYWALAISSSFGLMCLPQATPSASVWDSLHLLHLNRGETLPYFSAFNDAVRAKSVAYAPDYQALYFATNRGLLKVLPNTAHYEVKNKGESIFLKRLKWYNNSIFALSNKGSLYKLNPKDDSFQEIPIVLDGKQVTANDIKIEKNWLLLFCPKELIYIDLATGGFSINRFSMGIFYEDIRDATLWNDQLIITYKDKLLFLKKQAPPRPKLPLLVINNIKVGDRSYLPSQLLQLPYYSNDVEIDYSILSFNTYGQYPLYYRINEGEWKLLPDDSRQLYLASLAPDDYKVEFRLGKNNAFPIVPLAFSIKAAFWQKTWFWLLCFAIITSFGFVYYRWQTGLLKRRNALVVEKMELEKNLQQSVLTAIRSQMNPHFFYNALNTIQAYIFSGDKHKALGVLGNFSKLTRWVLETSEKEAISLTEEINSLRLYLDLEKARFGDDFSYHIQLSDVVQADTIKIPPMLIQPYIENALKHGLFHKPGEKTLSLGFDLADACLCITIDDNGIGRERSAEINKNSNKQHRSFATQANQTRIDILNKGKNNIGVHFTDKKDALGTALGTTVSIRIPLN